MTDTNAESAEVRTAGRLALGLAGAGTAAYTFWFVAAVFASTNSTAIVSLVFLPVPGLAVFAATLVTAFLGVSIGRRLSDRPVAGSQIAGGVVGVLLIVPPCAWVVAQFWG